MANRTVRDANSVKGTNPQYLIEKIIRTRIYECKFWKEECFALTAELLVDKAMALQYLGGVYGGNVKPCPFLCLLLKMLQIQPEKDIIVEFITQQEFKYVRALGALYMRLIGSSLDCYNYLEPLYWDYRKLRKQRRDGAFELTYMDEFIDELLHEERVYDIILPRLQKRQMLEDANELAPRTSALDDDLDNGIELDNTATDDHRERRLPYFDVDMPDNVPPPRFRRSRSPRDRTSRRHHDRERRSRSHEKSRDKQRRPRHNDERHHHSSHGSRRTENSFSVSDDSKSKHGHISSRR